jgi:hypothetical protein
MSRIKRYAPVFLLVFFLSTFAIVFHHHADGSDCHNCPACAAAHCTAVVIGMFALENAQPLATLELPSMLICYDSRAVAIPLPRAPPV